MALKPIETIYRGYRFRSRLEARWAVFFDTLGVRWEYEKEGYDLGPAGWYLPDFWLPDLEMWAEVKGEPFNSSEEAKARALADASTYEVLQLVGIPTYTVYWSIRPKGQGYSSDDRMDYVLDDQYCHDEHRWFSSPGLRDGEDASQQFYVSPRTRAAYAAARQARFEHGESPRR